MKKNILVSALVAAVALGAASTASHAKEQTNNAALKAVDGVKLISRDVLFGNPERSGVQVSPDGKYLSWRAPLDGVMNIWVAPIDKLDQAKAVTNDTKRGIPGYFWSHQPNTIVYVRDAGGDENFHVFSTNIKTKQAKDLTPYEKTRGQIIGVSDKHPESIMIGMNDRDETWHDLYRVDLKTGKRTLVEKNEDKLAGYALDSNYVVKQATRARADGGTDVLTKKDGKWVTADSIPFEDSLTTSYAGFNADGSKQYLVDSRGRNTSALYAIDTKSGKKTLIHEDARADVGGSMMHPTKKEVQAVAVNYLKNEWTVLDDSIAGDLKLLKAKLGDGEVSVVDRTQKDDIWIVAYGSPTVPYAYYRYDRPEKKLAKLFDVRPDLNGQPLVPQHPVVIKSRDGLDLVSYLSLPKGADKNNDGKADFAVPMVLLVHGGPWARDSYGYSSYDQWLTNRGYAVLAVNYRGSTGFGKEFISASNGEWAGKMHDDLIDAVNWAVKEGVTEKDKVAIMGGSYGGYATLVGLTFTPDTFACGVDIVGPSNLNTLLSTIPPYWASFFEQFARRVGDPRTPEGKKLLEERSPLNFVDKIKKPLLIGQGANDPRVKQAEADQIVEAMNKKGIPVTYALFPDEGHGFRRPENSKAFNAINEAFLSECLGGRSQPIGADLKGSSLQVPTGAKGVKGLEAALKGHKASIKK